MTYPIPDFCPVRSCTDKLTGLSKNMVVAMKQLKRSLKQCESCQAGEDCPILANFNSQVKTAIEDVVAEWDLSSYALTR